ncbi:hypothetical protein [Virgisporangium aurantiacum]|uniref:Uncharacterized protein n=1 Tax=Virgisporangium aurantiacum TaxID=175570 RepID=A0A8J3ZLI0_9ACTN|nr:hypothetical protein [Virgisporangium aurantiacum]GIJ64215.1 hypothetical protein Vau01_117310 [Virgisporangium aurantiacum]
MICPHCAASVKHRERSGHRCGRCGREFVFEPRDHASRLTDVQVRRAAAWLGEGLFRYTFGQLTATVGRGGAVPPNFRETMLLRWPQVHGSLPAGLVDERSRIGADPPIRPVTAHVLCPDRAVSACLLANDVQRRFDVLVRGRDAPAGTQTVLLFGGLDERAHKMLATLRRSGRRAVAVGPPAGRALVRVRPSVLVEWLDLAVRAETRFRDGARKAAAVDYLDWPGVTDVD